VIVIDLEQVEFPDYRRPWGKKINANGAMSLMRDFEDLRYPNRQPSPIRFWQVDV